MALAKHSSFNKTIPLQGICGCVTLLLWALCCGCITALSTLTSTFAEPITILGILFVALLDLLIRSPLIAAQAIFHAKTPCTGVIRHAFSREIRNKAILLRLILWKERLVFSALAFLPTAFTWSCADLITVSNPYSTSPIAFLLKVISFLFIVAGFLFSEWHMLPYWGAWAFLAKGATVQEAIQSSKKRVKRNREEAVRRKIQFTVQQVLCIAIFPYFLWYPSYQKEQISWFLNEPISNK